MIGVVLATLLKNFKQQCVFINACLFTHFRLISLFWLNPALMMVYDKYVEYI